MPNDNFFDENDFKPLKIITIPYPMLVNPNSNKGFTMTVCREHCKGGISEDQLAQAVDEVIEPDEFVVYYTDGEIPDQFVNPLKVIYPEYEVSARLLPSRPGLGRVHS